MFSRTRTIFDMLHGLYGQPRSRARFKPTGGARRGRGNTIIHRVVALFRGRNDAKISGSGNRECERRYKQIQRGVLKPQSRGI